MAGAPGAHQAPEPSRLGPEASSPVAAPGSATRAPSTRQKHRLTHQGITYSRGHLGLGVPCTPRHHPGMHIPRLAREAGLARGKDLDSNRGSRQGIVKCPRPQLPSVEESLWGMDPLGGWPTARRWPRTPGRGSAPVKRHSRIAVAGEQPHPRSRMGRSRRQTRASTPNSWDRGPSARRGTAPLISPPGRGGRERLPRSRKPPPGPQPPIHAPGGAFPGAQSPPPNGQPQPPTSIGRPGDLLRERDSPLGAEYST